MKPAITAIPIDYESFQPFGTFINMLEPTGNCFEDEGSIFYPDPVQMSVSGREQIAFSPLIVKKQNPIIVKRAEYHNWTGECIYFIDDDAVMHVAPPSNNVIVPDKTKAFIVPQGTLVKLNTGVWHLSPITIHNDLLHLIIIMQERVYGNDCFVCDFPEEDYFEIKF